MHCDYIDRCTVRLVSYRFDNIFAPLRVGEAQICIYYNRWTSVWHFQKDIGYVLQTRLTMLTKMKRNCGGTRAKLIIWVGVYTALCVRRCESGWGDVGQG